MFEAVVIKLLEGTFICRTAWPDLFFYLEDEAVRSRVDAYLGQIGRSLASTAHAEAYYAAYRAIGPEERTEIRALFREIKNELRPLLGFLNLIMQAQESDRTLVAGDVISFPKTLLSISESPHLSELLRGFSTQGKEFGSGDASPHKSLERLLQQMEKRGYLVADRQADRYQMTGKIDYFYEVADFLAENEHALREAQEQEGDEMASETETRNLF
jgi:hypothetical protein